MAELIGDQLSAYRRIVASTRDSEKVWWWYFGTSSVQIAGLPELMVHHVETLMVYSSLKIADNAFKISWSEVGCFIDPATGDLPTSWTNPLTGYQVLAPKTFREGPGEYTIKEHGGRLAITARQPHARPRSITTEWKALNHRLMLIQSEHKTRGFPKPDGTMPDLDTEGGFTAETELVFIVERSQVERTHLASADTQGSYQFTLGGIPPWMRFENPQGRLIVRGLIVKAKPETAPNSDATRRLRTLFPDFFGTED